ncbi:hypothetical protein [Pseudoxanthomonas koreensis]|uniref:hypothetical protein n=1 Tax=Pseudoxanthomonas koreensis TaxID=266061 RepID=UPI0013912B0A|nr:hypothetical protein [Pseudoxanthomonas koreensis]KAF1691458.1 hypothetical protein CSC64_09160 [Pseudoxanthomonas koreensis]
MNTRNKPQVDPGEWEAQERGMRTARARDADARLDEAAADYRIVAEALVSAPRSEPPAGFATAVAKHVARHEAGLERLLWRSLLVVFVVASAAMGAQYGAQWLQALQGILDGDALGWALAAVGCMALSWIGSRLFEPGHPAGIHAP